MKKLGLGLGLVRAKRNTTTPPANTVAPVASGTARVGQTLSVTDGTWTGTAPITYTYQWRRDGVNIGSATNSTYVLVTADLGTAIDCNVTATNAAGAVTQDSNNITVGSDLSAVLASAVFDLDATKAASYSGSGTTWANLVTAPADGSAQTAYDFLRGDGATSTTYPTFNGSAGSAAAYFGFDGGDYFNLKSGTNTAFLNALHKTTGGADFWFLIAWKSPSVTGTIDGFFGNASGTTTANSLTARQSTTEKIQLSQRSGAGAASTVNSTAGMTVDTINLAIFSHSKSGNNLRVWINSATAEDVAFTMGASSGDPATGFFTLGAITSVGTSPIANDGRVYTFAMGSEYLDNTKAAAIIAALNARHGRTYA